ncbi:MAG TPA: MotA/TolQ/ExbB proton channel family protein [Gammaproteobacteria bacterium]
MFEIIKAGGWIMWPIVAASVLALAIIIERFWSLRNDRVAPPNMLQQIWQWVKNNELDEARIRAIYDSSPLGRILAAGLVNRKSSREILKESIEDAGRHAAPELERHLRTLGTISAIAPFLGLLGTVFGMIDMFSGIGHQGLGDPSIVADGIAQALVATAGGLIVAIPSLIFYRYFRGRVSDLLLNMEGEAVKLVEILQGRRERLRGE